MPVTPPLALGARPTFALAVCALIGSLTATRAAADPPPEMMNYQGQLTDTSGMPITTPQTVFFSLWKGGDESTANSGAELFRESATVTPNATGIFSHQIGTGTVEASLDPSDFRVSEPIFLQVAVGSVGGVLLPRSRIVSVGFSFVADYANTAGAVTGLPEVTDVVDTTGGLTVVGDLLRIVGDGLSEAEVLIGGKPARVKSRTDSAIECQVPTGLPRGLNRVAVVEAETGKASNTRFHVDVHRLIVGVFGRSGSDRVFVIDANTGDLVASFDPGPIEDTLPPMQMAFAHEGALALIPANTSNGNLFAIDLTDDPPSLVDTYAPMGSRCASVAVSPDNVAVVTSHPDGNRLRTFGFGQHFPPYSSSVLDGSTTEIEGPASSSTYSPRGNTFIGNGLLLVCASGNGTVLGYRRETGTREFEDEAWEITEIAVGTGPFAITRTHDQSRVLVTNQSSANLRSFLVSSVGVSPDFPGGSAVGGPFALRMAVSPDGRTVMVADQSGSQPAEQGALQRGLVNIFGLSGSGLFKAGTYAYADYEDSGGNITGIDKDELLQLVAIDPVDGDLAPIGIQTGSVRIYERTGGALAFLKAVEIQGGSSSNGQMLEMQFQP